MVVGRAVANTEFMRALMRFGNFDRFMFFVGEAGDVPGLEAQFIGNGLMGRERLALPNLLTLPDVMAEGSVDVIHLGAFSGLMSDLVWLRDRYSPRSLPVTAQIHSLSYPRFLNDYLKAQLYAPGAGDAIVCSSAASRTAVQGCLEAASRALSGVGATIAQTECQLPVIPLGVDVERLASGDRAGTRARFGIPADAPVVLGIGRFTEYDKMDLFPVLQAFRGVVDRLGGLGVRPILLLAGARQGTKTPEMVMLWAKMLGIADRVILDVDFPDSEKSNLLAAADLFVSPSDNLQESFGMSVVEAMAAGLPVVVTDFDGYKDTVTDDVGVRVPARFAAPLERVAELSTLLYERPLHLLLGQSVEIDLPSLETAIGDLLMDRPRRAKLAQAATQRARAVYDWRVVIKQYEQLWTTLTEIPIGTKGAGHTRPPLAMDFERIFANYPSGRVPEARVVQRTALSRALVKAKNQYLVYPELRNVFQDEDVSALLTTAERPITLEALAKQDAQARPQFASWRRGHAIAWLLKHGLLG